MTCNLCGHSLENNSHGFDQNDFDFDESGNMIHSGCCTYCLECNPRLKAIIELNRLKKEQSK